MPDPCTSALSTAIASHAMSLRCSNAQAQRSFVAAKGAQMRPIIVRSAGRTRAVQVQAFFGAKSATPGSEFYTFQVKVGAMAFHWPLCGLRGLRGRQPAWVHHSLSLWPRCVAVAVWRAWMHVILPIPCHCKWTIARHAPHGSPDSRGQTWSPWSHGMRRMQVPSEPHASRGPMEGWACRKFAKNC